MVRSTVPDPPHCVRLTRDTKVTTARHTGEERDTWEDDVGRVNEAAKRKMLREFAVAQERGHACDTLIPVRQTKTQTGWAVLCSCGWKSNPKKRRLAAASLGYMHVLDVVHDVVPPCEEMRGEVLPENARVSLPEIVGQGL